MDVHCFAHIFPNPEQDKGRIMNLYKVTTKGPWAYVVAPDPTAAYMKMRRDLDARQLGLKCDRELVSIELMASNIYKSGRPWLYI